MEHWQEVIPHREEVFLEGFEIFKNHLVVTERRNGLINLRVRPWSGSDEHEVDFGEPAYFASPKDNHEFDTPLLRYSYSSMTTPNSVHDYNMVAREKTLLKRDEVLGGFDWATIKPSASVRPLEMASGCPSRWFTASRLGRMAGTVAALWVRFLRIRYGCPLQPLCR